MKQEFLKIAKKRMKGIVSQVRRGGERPYWIDPELWKVMLIHWATPKAIERSTTASQSRNSDRGGLGPHIHLSGQTSYLQIQQDMVISFSLVLKVDFY